jgi:signal peptidase I
LKDSYENESNAPEQVPAASDDNGETLSSSMKIIRECYDWVEIFVITITSIFLVFTFIMRIAYVDGPSMNETLHHKETIVVSNLMYKPKNGDIVVFQSPDSGIRGGIVKRVIATAGQVVDIDFDSWTVVVDGIPLDEPYVNYVLGSSMRSFDVEFPVTVPEGYVFVMGDNRNQSNDSRSSQIGFVDTRFIFGHLLFRITPLSRFGIVN